jgi:hypothetical protein
VSEGGGFRAQCRICECVDPVSRLVQFLKEKKSECVNPVSRLVQFLKEKKSECVDPVSRLVQIFVSF